MLVLLMCLLFCLPARSGEPLRIGLVVDTAGLGDRSFNDSAHEGLMKARETFSIATLLAEPAAEEEIFDYLQMMADSGYDLIISVGVNTADALRKAASLNPKNRFALIDSIVELPNVASLVFREEEGAYLAGMAAASASRTGIIGFIGGMDIPLIHKLELGYTQGAFAVNPDVRVINAYAGNTPSAWSVPSMGRDLALKQHGSGADVIFHAAGCTGLGVINAAREAGFFAIGVDRDQDSIAPGTVLCSMLKRVDLAVYNLIRDLSRNSWQSGVHSYGLAEGGLGLSEFTYTKEGLPASVFIELECGRRDIIAGRIMVNAVKK